MNTEQHMPTRIALLGLVYALWGCLDIDPVPPATQADAQPTDDGRVADMQPGDSAIDPDVAPEDCRCAPDQMCVNGECVPRGCTGERDCEPSDDPCFEVYCAASGICERRIVRDTACDDGNFCNGEDACNAVGECVPVAPARCPPGLCAPDGQACVDCEAECIFEDRCLDGLRCGDNGSCMAGRCVECDPNACAINEQCFDGRCVPIDRPVQLRLTCLGEAGFARMTCGDMAVQQTCRSQQGSVPLDCPTGLVEICCSSGADCTQGRGAGATPNVHVLRNGEYTVPESCRSERPGVVECVEPALVAEHYFCVPL